MWYLRPLTMYMKSLYPSVPQTPNSNYHHALFSNSEQGDSPDYTLHIDGLTGRKRSRKEFDERMKDGATTLAAPLDQGGLALDGQSGHVVGIISTNCLVTPSWSIHVLHSTAKCFFHCTGLHRVRTFAAYDCNTICAYFCLFYRRRTRTRTPNHQTFKTLRPCHVVG